MVFLSYRQSPKKARLYIKTDFVSYPRGQAVGVLGTKYRGGFFGKERSTQPPKTQRVFSSSWQANEVFGHHTPIKDAAIKLK